MQTGRRVLQLAMPAWGWAFVVGCGIIPIVALGGFLPCIIGFAGAYGCANTARDPFRTVARRVATCAGLTVLCWVLFLAVFVGSVALHIL